MEKYILPGQDINTYWDEVDIVTVETPDGTLNICVQFTPKSVDLYNRPVVVVAKAIPVSSMATEFQVVEGLELVERVAPVFVDR